MATQIKVIVENNINDSIVLFLDLADNQPLTANYQFKDIQDIKANKGNHTFNFRVPSTPKNNLFFGDYFLVTSLGNYDPRKKADIEILVDTIQVFSGYLQLTNVIVSNGNIASYECVCFNSIASLGQIIEGVYLRDYDWSFYDHDVNITNITESMNRDVTPFKNGDIVYSLYDYGGGFVGTTNSYVGINLPQGAINIKNLKPQMRLKTIWDKIIAEAGFTYESEFIDEEFLDIYLDLNNGTELISEGGQAFYVCQLGSLGTQTFTEAIDSHIIEFGNTSFSAYANAANQFDTITSILTPATFYSQVNFILSVTFSTSGSFTSADDFKIGLFTESSVGSGNFDVEEYTSPVQSMVNQQGLNTNIMLNLFNVYIDNTKRYVAKVTQTQLGTGAATTITISATWNWYPTPSGTQIGFNGFGQNNLFNGSFVFDTSFNFGDLKSLDVITSLCKKFNLVIIPDDIETTHLYIEPYKDWIENGEELNWTSKLDKSKDIQLKPTVDLQAKLLKFEDSEAEDLWNVWYRQQSNERYGSFLLTNDSDFGKKVDTIETIFAPTITRRISDTEIVNSICHGENYQPVKGNRLSFYNGYVNSGATNYYLTDGLNTNSYTEYAKFSNYKDSVPTDTTETLTFQPMPNSVIAPMSIFGAFQVYWKRFIDETYSIDSRLLIATFQLSALDIMSLNFNDIVFIENEYYRINKINSYPLVGKGTCKVELIKVLRTNECGVTLHSVSPNGFASFEDEQTGVVSQNISEECCITLTQSYQSSYSSALNKCLIFFGKNVPIYEPQSNKILGGNNAVLGNFNSVNGSNNSLTTLNSINGSANFIKETSTGVKILGDLNEIGTNSNNINIVGSENYIAPTSLSIDNAYLKVQTSGYLENVIMRGDYGTAITSGDNVISGGADKLYNEAGRSASGEFVKTIWTDGKEELYIGQHGVFDFGSSSNSNAYYKSVVENCFKTNYPSFLGFQIDIVGHQRGSLSARSQNFTYRRYTGVIQNTSNSGTISAKETTIDIQKEGSIFTPYTFEIFPISAIYLGNQYIGDGSFCFKINTQQISNLGNVDWTISFKYTLTGLQNLGRSIGSRIFSPTSITGCLLWLDAQDPSTITHSSGSVSQWDDKSGNNHDVVIALSGGNPTYSQLLYDAYIEFGGTDVAMINFDSSLYNYNASANTIFVVFKGDSSSDGGKSGHLIAGSAYRGRQTNGIFAEANSTNGGGGLNHVGYTNNQVDRSCDSNNLSVTTKQVVCGTFDGTSTCKFFNQNGLQQTTTTGNTTSLKNSFAIGGGKLTSSIGDQFDGKIYEIIAYDNELSDAQREQVFNYLTTKWTV